MAPSSHQLRLLALAALAASALALTGCPPVQPPKPALTQPAAGPPVPAIGNDKEFPAILLPLPPSPLTDGALQKALIPRAQIAQIVARAASTLPAAPTQPASTEPHDAPPAALKAYLAGREKFIDANYPAAITLLQQALKDDPESFSALRLIGRAYFASAQLARGSVFLQHAAAIDPADVDVNYLLGRFFLEQKEYPTAIHYFLNAVESPERTDASSLAPLSSVYLARAFQLAGYHLAAAEEYQQFLRIAQQPVPAYRLDTELSLLMDLRWTTEFEIAENYFLAGQFAQAQPHYLAATQQRQDDAYIISRLLFNEVSQNQIDRATNQAFAFVAASKASDDSIRLLEWVYRRAGHENALLPDLQSRAQAPGASSSAVLALAIWQEHQAGSDAALKTLATRLAHQPADLDVLARLVQIVAQSKTYDTQAFVSTAAALAAAPDQTDAILTIYTPLLATVHARRLVEAVTANQWPQNHPASLATGMEHYLYGLVLRNTPQTQDAQAQFAAAVQDAPDFWPAREASITVLLEREKFSAAESLVNDAVARGMAGIKTRQITIILQVAEQHYAEAQSLAEQARNDFPDHPDFRLQLAAIDRLRQNNAAAATELKAAVERFPTVEKVYQQLIEVYLAENKRDDAASTVGLLLHNIPASRYGRLVAAQLCAAAGSYAQAESFIRNVLAENPDDSEAVIALSTIRYNTGKAPEAESMLTAALDKAAAPNPAMVGALSTMLRNEHRAPDAVALTEKYSTKFPDSDLLAIMHVSSLLGAARLADAESFLKDGLERLPRSALIANSAAELYQRLGRPQDAVDVIRRFLSLNGETAQQLYILAHYQFQAGDEDGSNATLQHALEIMPDHIAANNDLGFFWADQGKNLDQSEAMIKKAVANEPDNPAYLDSLAWVYYKRGQFDKAIAQLQHATSLPGGKEPDILGHLGDALYRAGKSAQAADTWQEAHALIPETAGPPLDKLRAYLDDALQAIKENRPPNVSPLAPKSKPDTEPEPLTPR